MDLTDAAADAELSRKRERGDGSAGAAAAEQPKRLKVDDYATPPPPEAKENLPTGGAAAPTTAESEATASPTADSGALGGRHEPLTAPPTDPAELREAIKKQIEYYFSDANMKTDVFFQKKISENPEGWLNSDHVLSCRNIKRLNVVSASDVVAALEDSALETKQENDAFWIRRTTPLPPLDEAALKKKENLSKANRKELKLPDMKTFHDCGCIVKASGVPEEAGWQAVKDAVKPKLPNRVIIKFVSQMQQNGCCYIWILKFDGDVELFTQGVTVEVCGCEVEVKLVTDPQEGHRIIRGILPPPVVRQRDLVAKRIQKQNVDKSFTIGEKTFASLSDLRKEIKSYVRGAPVDVNIPKDHKMFQVIHELLKLHPSAEQKMRQLANLKVSNGPEMEDGKNNGKCFWVVRENGEVEDFSVYKCIGEFENRLKNRTNPKAAEPPKTDEAAAAAEAPAGSSAAAATEAAEDL